MSDKIFPVLKPDLQIGFYYRLKNIRDLYFHDALSNTIKNLPINFIDKELNGLVPNDSLQKLASFSLRGEVLFPTPIILKTNPYLLGYYRLLLGFSQKEFYSKGPFGQFKNMEEKGKLTKAAEANLENLCKSLVLTASNMLMQIDDLNKSIISDLQLITVGPQLRGSINNKYGQIATEKTFSIIKEIVHKSIINTTLSSIQVKNDSGRIVTIKFSADPDIEIVEQLSSGDRGLVSIEIKGGMDISNIHNRIGEAEKSHQKAKIRGYFEFMTIISVDMDYSILKSESPTTSHFFNLIKLTDKKSSEFLRFSEIISSIVGLKI